MSRKLHADHRTVFETEHGVVGRKVAEFERAEDAQNYVELDKRISGFLIADSELRTECAKLHLDLLQAEKDREVANKRITELEVELNELKGRVDAYRQSLQMADEEYSKLIAKQEAARALLRKTEEEREIARNAIVKAEEIAKESSLMIGDEHHEYVACRFQGAKKVECFACLVQDKLAEIRVEKLTQKEQKGSEG